MLRFLDIIFTNYLIFIIVFIPMYSAHRTTYPTLTKQQKDHYLALKSVGVVFVFIASISFPFFAVIFSNIFVKYVMFGLLIYISDLARKRFYKYWIKKNSSVKYKILTDFYADLIYALIILLPGTIYYWINNYKFIFGL